MVYTIRILAVIMGMTNYYAYASDCFSYKSAALENNQKLNFLDSSSSSSVSVSEISEPEAVVNRQKLALVAHVLRFKKCYALPHIAYPTQMSHMQKNIINNSDEAIKVKIFKATNVRNFNLNFASGLLQNDNSTLTFEYQSPWAMLKPQETVSFIEPYVLMDTHALSQKASGDLIALFKIHARFADKSKRNVIKNKYRIFDVGDKALQTNFTVNCVKEKIKIMRVRSAE